MQLDCRICQTTSQVLALLPVDLDRLGDETVPVLGVTVPELLLQGLVREPLILRETKLEREAAWRAVGGIDLEAGDLECLKAVGEDLGVGGLDEVLDLRGALLEN